MAVPERRRFEIGNCRAHRGGDAVGKPDSRARLESAGEGFRHHAFAPAAETAVRVRGAQIDLLPGQAALLLIRRIARSVTSAGMINASAPTMTPTRSPTRRATALT